jgi:hypothetical protein
LPAGLSVTRSCGEKALAPAASSVRHCTVGSVTCR